MRRGKKQTWTTSAQAARERWVERLSNRPSSSSYDDALARQDGAGPGDATAYYALTTGVRHTADRMAVRTNALYTDRDGVLPRLQDVLTVINKAEDDFALLRLEQAVEEDPQRRARRWAGLLRTTYVALRKSLRTARDDVPLPDERALRAREARVIKASAARVGYHYHNWFGHVHYSRAAVGRAEQVLLENTCGVERPAGMVLLRAATLLEQAETVGELRRTLETKHAVSAFFDPPSNLAEASKNAEDGEARQPPVELKFAEAQLWRPTDLALAVALARAVERELRQMARAFREVGEAVTRPGYLAEVAAGRRLVNPVTDRLVEPPHPVRPLYLHDRDRARSERGLPPSDGSWLDT